ncbi:hypothetical protein LLEC1_00766 [Akanthomyces lecanii]|uniref:Transcription factor domain-containing protein n=1 Tax=Cordyceps confragosa TaxID=2714763 RepID=A0A179I895_CORDF|nr:hypothetical protein LLEC1_00766 [Akanthomyces lecanii]
MPRAKNQGSSEPKRRSRTGCCNEFIMENSAADSIGVALQRYATEPNSANTGPIHYEFEHTLFQDLQRESDMSSSVVVKKKAKSMDDAFSLGRTPADIRFASGVETIDTTATTMQYSGTAQSPSSTFSINEETVTSLSEQSDTMVDPYYLEKAPSPGDMQLSSAWNNAGVMMGCMTSTSPQLSRVASCTSDEMMLKSIWVDPAAVETSERGPSVDDMGTDAVECPTRLSYMAQVGYSIAPTCSMMCLVSGKPWMMGMGDDGTLAGTGNFEMMPEQSAAATEIPAWILNSDYRQTINSLPRGIAPIPDKLKDETNMMDHFVNYTAKAVHRSQVLRMMEPELRIAEWAEDIFSVLRVKLNDQTKPVSDDTLLSMVLLTSLEKSSPSTFGACIPWQKHLNLARSLMVKRVESMRAQNGKNEEFSFIFSWFSYLDAMGQVSTSPVIEGIPEQTGPFGLSQRISVEDKEEFDCVMGFTTRCGQLLTELASQIRQWPSAEQADDTTMQAALSLETKFKESMKKPVKVCRHLRKNKIDMRSLTEMDAGNQAFHWAGIVYLRRRILRKGPEDEEVQDGAQRIWESSGPASSWRPPGVTASRGTA